MSNQNKTTIKKTLLLTATIVSLGLISTANAEPELDAVADEAVERVDTAVEETVPELGKKEDAVDTTTDDSEDSKAEDEDDAHKEGKCGG